ncbi:MAG: hypothetical protein PWQ86_2021 [Bacillota bacterium]|nr:hypothetical protein [Bacillota bacterium]
MDSRWLEYIREKFDHAPFFRFLNAQIAELQAGSATVFLPVTEQLLNTYGTCHGGVLAALADMSMGLALRTLKLKVVTVELAVNYLQPVYPGCSLVAAAQAVYQGRRLIMAETEIRCRENLVAKGKGTFIVTGADEEEAKNPG